MQSAVRSLLMMKNAGYILFMHFDYKTAKKNASPNQDEETNTAMEDLSHETCPGPLNDQLSSLGAVFSSSGWDKPGRVDAGCGVRAQGQ